jgi:hypothetical protein
MSKNDKSTQKSNYKEVKPFYTKEEIESKKPEDNNKFKNEHPLEKKGEIEFSTGKHQVLIKTPNLDKKEVWISIDESGIDPTCSYLEGDLFGVKEVEEGFIIIANVESNGRKVYWFVK